MAKHHRRHYRHYRHNPVSTGLFKDVLWQIGGFAASSYGSGLVGQSGWVDVAVTAIIGIGLGYAGKAIGAGGTSSEELVKGGLFAAGLKAIKQTGVAIPGLSSYVPNYFSAPTASDPYGRATAPTVMLPAPAPSGGGKLGAGPVGIPYGRYRTRFMTRF